MKIKAGQYWKGGKGKNYIIINILSIDSSVIDNMIKLRWGCWGEIYHKDVIGTINHTTLNKRNLEWFFEPISDYILLTDKSEIEKAEKLLELLSMS